MDLLFSTDLRLVWARLFSLHTIGIELRNLQLDVLFRMASS